MPNKFINNENSLLSKGKYQITNPDTKTVYNLLGVIGTGGSSIAYKARVNVKGGDGEYVVVKELFPQQLNITRNTDGSINVSEDEADSFKIYRNITARESEAVKNAAITDENNNGYILGLFEDCFETNNTVYSVYKTEGGEILKDIMDRSAQTGGELNVYRLRRACGYIRQICGALKSMHDNGYLHLDIAPDNIFISHTGTGEINIAKLIDFNTSFKIGSDITARPFSYKQGYSAFELSGLYKEIIIPTEATDIYSVTAIFFEMLTGKKTSKVRLDLVKEWEISAGGDLTEPTAALINKILKRGLSTSLEARYQKIGIFETNKETGIKNTDADCFLTDFDELVNQIFDIPDYAHGRAWDLSKEKLGFLPKELGYDIDSDLMTCCTVDSKPEEYSFADALSSCQKNAILYGSGGIGKTTAMLSVWKDLVSEYHQDKPVPLFVKLNKFNDSEGEHFISRYVTDTYFNDRTDNFTKLEEIFKTPLKNNEPSFLLLLDGFNEIVLDEAHLKKITDEIQHLASMEGVQVVLSARDNLEAAPFTEGFCRINNHPLSSDNVKKYVEKRVNKTFADEMTEGLLSLLSNPMLLNKYIEIAFYENQKDKSSTSLQKLKESKTTGDVLDCYLNYLVEITKSVDVVFKEAFDQALPYLMYCLERENSFSLTYEQAKEILKGYFRHDSEKEDKDLEDILKAMSEKITLLHTRKIGGTIYFSVAHQTYRDFLAAKHIFNSIEKYMSKGNELPVELMKKDRVISKEVRIFLSDLLGDPNNSMSTQVDEKKDSTNQRTWLRFLLIRCDRLLRENQKEQVDAREGIVCAVYNILGIMLQAKEDCADISNKDFDLDDSSRLCLRKFKIKYAKEIKGLESFYHYNHIRSVLGKSAGRRKAEKIAKITVPTAAVITIAVSMFMYFNPINPYPGDFANPVGGIRSPSLSKVELGGSLTYEINFLDDNEIKDIEWNKRQIDLVNFTANVVFEKTPNGGENSRKLVLSNIQGDYGVNKYLIVRIRAFDYNRNASHEFESGRFAILRDISSDDTTPPSVNISAEADVVNVGGKITYTVIADDNANIEKFELIPQGSHFYTDVSHYIKRENIDTIGFTADISVAGTGNTQTITLSNIQGEPGKDKYIALSKGVVMDAAGNVSPPCNSPGFELQTE